MSSKAQSLYEMDGGQNNGRFRYSFVQNNNLHVLSGTDDKKDLWVSRRKDTAKTYARFLFMPLLCNPHGLQSPTVRFVKSSNSSLSHIQFIGFCIRNVFFFGLVIDYSGGSDALR